MVNSQTIVIATLAILGLSSLGGGVFMGMYVNSQLQTGIENKLKIDPNYATKDPAGYKDWLSNTDPNDAPTYKKYYFWNLTNPNEYLQGAKPVLNQIGPYSYREYDVKVGVSITSTQVSYNTFTYYVFDKNASFAGASPDTDKIVNVNPQYIGVLQSAGSEAALVTAFVGPAISQIIDGLNANFPYSVKASGMQTIFDGLNVTFVGKLPYMAGAQGLGKIIKGLTTDFAKSVLIQGMGTVLQQVQAGAIPSFQEAVNATTSANLIGFTFSSLVTAAGGNVTTALMNFFNNVSSTSPFPGVAGWSTYNLSFSNATAAKILLDGSGTGIPGWTQDLVSGTGILGFLQAYQWAIEGSHSLNNATLQSIYGASQAQLDLAVGYLINYFITNNPAVESTYEGSNNGETTLQGAHRLFAEQWGWGNITTPLNVTQNMNPSNFELKPNSNISSTVLKYLWNSTNPLALTNLTGILTWFTAAGGDPTATAYINSLGLTTTQKNLIYSWLVAFNTTFAGALVWNNLNGLGLTTTNDIGFFQWGTSILTGGKSVASLDPSITAPIEFWYYEQPTTLTLANVTNLMTGPYNLTDATGLGTFMLLGSQAVGGNGTALVTLNTIFGTTLKVPEIAKLLDYLQNVLINNIVLSQLPISTYADAGYYQFANGTITGGVSLHQLDPVDVPANISLWSVTGHSISLANSKALFSGQYSLVTAKGIGALAAYLSSAAAGNATSLGIINSLFGTTLSQADAVALSTYLNYAYQYLILPQLPVSSYSDLGYFQWANGTLTHGLSVYNIDPTGLPGTVEYWVSAGMNMSLANAKALLLTGNTLANSTLVGVALSMATAFATAYAASDTATMLTLTNAFNAQAGSSLSPGEFGGLLKYLQHIFNQFIISATLDPIFNAGGGMITTRTPTQWLFNYQDPLLVFLKANGQSVPTTNGNFFSNPPASEQNNSINATIADIYLTGGDNINNVGQYVKYQGQTTITGIWLQPESITGTDGTQFHPNVQKTDNLKVWSSDLMRVLTFTYQKDVSIQGINLMQFGLDPSTLDVNAKYYQTVKGLANMTSAAGAPLFLSKPDFLDADASKTSDLVTGMSPNATLDDTYLDVEPNTGAVFSAAKRLQLNFLVGPSDLFTKNVTKAYVPVMWVEQSGQITPALANDFKSAVYGAQSLQNLVQIGGPLLGVVFLASSAGTVVVTRKPKT